MSNLTAEHGGMRLGRVAPTAEDHARALKLSAFVGEELPEPPTLVDYLAAMSEIPMLGNDRVGNCVRVACMHLAQAVTAVMGRERVFTEAEALAAYERDGYVPGDDSTDQGANLFAVLEDWRLHPEAFGDIEIEGWASVDMRDWRKQQQAMWLFGGVLQGYDLPRITQRQEVWRVEMGAGDFAIERGGWGGHAVHGGRRIYNRNGLPALGITTWGKEVQTTSGFGDHYGAENAIVLVKGWEPPDVPGFDRDRLLAAMRELQR